MTTYWIHIESVLVGLTSEGEPLTTTPEHPFYTRKGWVAADDLWLNNPTRRSWLALVHRPNAVKWGRGAGCGGQWGSWFAKNLDQTEKPHPCRTGKGVGANLPIPTSYFPLATSLRIYATHLEAADDFFHAFDILGYAQQHIFVGQIVNRAA